MVTENRRRTLEEWRCDSVNTHDALCTVCIAWPQCLAAHEKHGATVVRMSFRCEIQRVKLGRHQGRGGARLSMLLIAWTKL
jgi:hypothetical protein